MFVKKLIKKDKNEKIKRNADVSLKNTLSGKGRVTAADEEQYAEAVVDGRQEIWLKGEGRYPEPDVGGVQDEEHETVVHKWRASCHDPVL